MSEALENLLQEDRLFAVDPEFAAHANAQPGIHEEANDDFTAFWQK